MLEYGFVVTNSGNTTLSNVTLTAPLISSAVIAGCSSATLLPARRRIVRASIRSLRPTWMRVRSPTWRPLREPGLRAEATASDAITTAISTDQANSGSEGRLQELTGAFLARRVDRVLQNEPGLNSLQNRVGRPAGRAGGQSRWYRKQPRRHVLDEHAGHAIADVAAGR